MLTHTHTHAHAHRDMHAVSSIPLARQGTKSNSATETSLSMSLSYRRCSSPGRNSPNGSSPNRGSPKAGRASRLAPPNQSSYRQASVGEGTQGHRALDIGVCDAYSKQVEESSPYHQDLEGSQAVAHVMLAASLAGVCVFVCVCVRVCVSLQMWLVK